MKSAILLTAIIAGIGIVYDSIEFYQERTEVLQYFYNWRVVRSRFYVLIRRPVLAFFLDSVFAPGTFLALVMAHGVAAVLFPVVFYFNAPIAALIALFILAVHGLINIRLLVGRDGADQMQNIIWAGLFAVCLPLNETVRWVAIGFIIAQLVLSYLTSGIAKLLSAVWRDGSGVQLITRMATYCPPGIAGLFRNRRLSFITCWLIILFEIFSPLLLFFGQTGVIVFITLGTLFHASIAVAMGLTTFVFAFVATYPVLYVFVMHWG